MWDVIGKLLAVLFMFAVLFDPDGAQYGLLFAVPPAPAIVLAHFIGNILWVMGILYFFMGVMLFLIALVTELLDKVMDELMKNNPKVWDVLSNKRWYESSFTAIAFISAMVAIGSDFWFFGLMWLFCLAGGIAYKFELRKACKLAEAKKTVEELEGK